MQNRDENNIVPIKNTGFTITHFVREIASDK